MQNKHCEIEYKYLIDPTKIDFQSFPFDRIEQAYISVSPVIRIRRCNESYILTVKGSGMVKRSEYELTLDAGQYRDLSIKAEGIIITKKRYYLPYFFAGKEYTIELDIFEGDLTGLILAEVEFSSVEEAEAFIPPAWFLENVSHNPKYHNSYLSQHGNSIFAKKM